jgi:hypothetical protein
MQRLLFAEETECAARCSLPRTRWNTKTRHLALHTSTSYRLALARMLWAI